MCPCNLHTFGKCRSSKHGTRHRLLESLQQGTWFLKESKIQCIELSAHPKPICDGTQVQLGGADDAPYNVEASKTAKHHAHTKLPQRKTCPVNVVDGLQDVFLRAYGWEALLKLDSLWITTALVVVCARSR
eukprot:4134066-Amphidinium_carterae.1